jgi:hypothetical protein
MQNSLKAAFIVARPSQHLTPPATSVVAVNERSSARSAIFLSKVSLSLSLSLSVSPAPSLSPSLARLSAHSSSPPARSPLANLSNLLPRPAPDLRAHLVRERRDMSHRVWLPVSSSLPPLLSSRRDWTGLDWTDDPLLASRCVSGGGTAGIFIVPEPQVAAPVQKLKTQWAALRNALPYSVS